MKEPDDRSRRCFLKASSTLGAPPLPVICCQVREKWPYLLKSVSMDSWPLPKTTLTMYV
jgi:hypothetical protein